MSQRLGISWPFYGLVFALLFPSTAVVQRFLGLAGVAAYLAAASFLLWLGQRRILPWVSARFPADRAIALGGVTFAALTALVVLLYPLVDAGIFGGGSDGDDALDVAAAALLQGQYPYYPRTYLGNHISPLPGSILLATPFVLMGGSAYQNLFWLLLFTVTVAVALRSAVRALLMLWTMLLLSPALLHALIIGSDYIANGIFVLLFIWWLIRWTSRPGSSRAVTILLAALLGVGLASRVNFILLVPLVYSALSRRVGWQPATGILAVTMVTLAGLILTFLLYDPLGFTPLGTYTELGRFDVLVPRIGIMIPLATAVIAVALAWQNNAPASILFRNCTVVLAFPVLCGTVLMSVAMDQIDFSFASFGVLFLFFGAVAFWPEAA